MNHALTKTIIELHEKGFTEDFCIADDLTSLCSPHLKSLAFPVFTISIINQGYDQLTQCYKYLHAIETPCGIKGLLLSSQVFFNHKIDRNVISECLRKTVSFPDKK
jgi:hypothetical protein